MFLEKESYWDKVVTSKKGRKNKLNNKKKKWIKHNLLWKTRNTISKKKLKQITKKEY